MANQDSYDILIEVEGEQSLLAVFAELHLSTEVFSFNSVSQMPVELNLERNNFVEDGFDALFGDWAKLSGRWMFKGAAMVRGFPFPLGSREQVIECIKDLGSDGDKRIELGKQFKSNLDRFGYGDGVAWRKENWGVECDADEVVVGASAERIDISFSICGPFPKKMFSMLSSPFPDLRFVISSIGESGKRGKKFLVLKGKEVKKFTTTDEEIRTSILRFRQASGVRWLEVSKLTQEALEHVEMNERGRAVFKGTNISVDFALRRLSSGESREGLALRYPELTKNHLHELGLLVGGRKVTVK